MFGQSGADSPDNRHRSEIGKPIAPGLRFGQVDAGQRFEDQTGNGNRIDKVGKPFACSFWNIVAGAGGKAQSQQPENRRDDRKNMKHVDPVG
jgi:hypothetical protein